MSALRDLIGWLAAILIGGVFAGGAVLLAGGSWTAAAVIAVVGAFLGLLVRAFVIDRRNKRAE